MSAAPEVVLAEPRVEEVEDREQALARRRRGARDGFETSRPPLRPAVQHGDDEVVLGGEQAVDALQGDPSLRSHGVHPYRVHPVRVEQPVRCGHDLAARRRVVHPCSPSSPCAENQRSLL
jgi:hypothetical protein